MVYDRLEGARRLLATVRPFLQCTTIPLPMKASAVRSVILPRLMFGAEIYGMNKAITSKVQVIVDQRPIAILGLSPRSTVSNIALWRELQVPFICASAASKRARALQKCRKPNTWVKELTQRTLRVRRWAWVSRTGRWLNRYLTQFARDPNNDLPEKILDNGGWVDLSPKTLGHDIKTAVWRREDRCKWARFGVAYRAAGYERHSLTAITSGAFAQLSVGLTVIAKCRVGGFWPAQRLAKQGLIC